MADHPDLTWAIQDIRDRAQRVAKYRDMYEGNHPSMLDSGKTLAPVMHDLLEELNDNLCDDVVDEPVARMGLKSITSTDSAVAAAAGDAFEANKGHARLSYLFRDSWMAGDAFAIVEQDRLGRPRFYAQSPEQMAVRYSPTMPDDIELAAKVWKEGRRWRITLYYGPEHPEGPKMERYASKGSSGDGGVPEARAFLPLEGEDENGLPLAVQPTEWDRIPVFHFPSGEVGRYGRSVLSDVIPLQLVLNKSAVDMVVAMEEVALPGRWATGISVMYNDDGTEKPLFRRAKSALEVMRTSSTDAKFGQFSAADLSQFLTVQKDYRAEIARKGYLPLRSVGLGEGGGQPSGISLLVEEGRQVKRVKDARRDWGGEIKEMLAYMLRLNGTAVESKALSLEWERAETRDDQALWELIMIKADMGVPKQVLLEEGGYDAADVRGWLEDDNVGALEGGRVSAPGTGLGFLATSPVPGNNVGLPAGPVA